MSSGPAALHVGRLSSCFIIPGTMKRMSSMSRIWSVPRSCRRPMSWVNTLLKCWFSSSALSDYSNWQHHCTVYHPSSNLSRNVTEVLTRAHAHTSCFSFWGALRNTLLRKLNSVQARRQGGAMAANAPTPPPSTGRKGPPGKNEGEIMKKHAKDKLSLLIYQHTLLFAV